MHRTRPLESWRPEQCQGPGTPVRALVPLLHVQLGLGQNRVLRYGWSRRPGRKSFRCNFLDCESHFRRFDAPKYRPITRAIRLRRGNGDLHTTRHRQWSRPWNTLTAWPTTRRRSRILKRPRNRATCELCGDDDEKIRGRSRPISVRDKFERIFRGFFFFLSSYPRVPVGIYRSGARADGRFLRYYVDIAGNAGFSAALLDIAVQNEWIARLLSRFFPTAAI